MAGAVIFPFQLSTFTHNSSHKNSVLNKRGLLQSSFVLKPTEGVPVRKCDRSSILCSADRRGKKTSAAAVPKPIPLVPPETADIPEPKRSDFPSPPDFYFGAASSAYQVFLSYSFVVSTELGVSLSARSFWVVTHAYVYVTGRRSMECRRERRKHLGPFHTKYRYIYLYILTAED